MAGRLVVVGRRDASSPWAILGAAVDAPTAQALVTAFLDRMPGARAAVLQVIRSFASTASTAEDAVAVIDP